MINLTLREEKEVVYLITELYKKLGKNVEVQFYCGYDGFEELIVREVKEEEKINFEIGV